jgi:aldehyde:ferredoxin oxidoreductase
MKAAAGYLGKVLRVDLSAGQAKDEVLADALIEKYVGGTGIGAKILYDEVPPGVEWNDPKNRLILFSGPLGATRISGTGTFP